MTMPTSSINVPQRPDFMIVLGLLPPYMAADVEKAYLTKLKEIRPDLGGDRQAFYEVQKAYTKAKEYVQYRGDRLGWIAKQIDNYVAVQEISERLKRFGAEVQIRALDWLRRSFGEFAELTQSIVGVRLRGATNGDEVLEFMVSQHERLLELRSLDMVGCNVSDGCVRQLIVFRRLAELDLSRTPITWQGLQVVHSLPELQRVGIEAVKLSWLARRRLAAQLRQNGKTAAAVRTLHPINVR